MNIVQQTSGGFDPVEVADMEAHLKLDQLNNDEAQSERDLLTNYIRSATELVEGAAGRPIATRTYKGFMDEFPYDNGQIEIYLYPVSNITAVKYFDTDGIEQTFADSKYHTDIQSNPARIVLKSGESWPSTQTAKPNAVTIEFTAGYENKAAVPDKLRSPIRYLAAHYFTVREPITVLPTFHNIAFPRHVESLIRQIKLNNWAGR